MEDEKYEKDLGTEPRHHFLLRKVEVRATRLDGGRASLFAGTDQGLSAVPSERRILPQQLHRVDAKRGHRVPPSSTI